MTSDKIEQYKILAGQIAVHSMLVPMIIYGYWYHWLLSFFVYFLMMTFGISTFNHRYLSHKSITILSTPLKYFSIFLSTISLQGSSLAWVAMHREHHAHSDTEKDPHSPQYDGFWHSYFLSMMHSPNIKRYGIDLLRDKTVIFFHKNYWKINFIYSALLVLLFGIFGPVFLHWIPAVMQWHGSSIVNGLAHYHKPVPKFVGYRNFETSEHSKNLPLFAYLTFGEGWHNNHHGKPASYTFKHKWYEYDMVASILTALSKIKAIKIND